MMSGKCSLEVRRLIAEVQRRPELWDRQHPQHHCRSVLEQHWESVATVLTINGINGKSARGKWKNLKDHFRKEYKRCMRTDCDQEMSKWPYFHYMMFIKDQISHTVSNSLYLSDFQSQNIYSEVKTEEVSDEDNPLNCVNAEYDNQSLCEVKLDYSNENENISDDKHFLLSLLPMFSALSPDKKLKARIAIETSLLNITYPNLSTPENSQVQQKSPNKSEKRKRTSEDEHHQKNNPSKVKKCLL